MSEDEESVDSAADAEEADGGAPVDGAESGEEQDAPAGTDAGDGSAATGDEGTADGTEADGFVTADPEPAAMDDEGSGEQGAESAAAGEGGGSPVSEDIVDRVAAYDDDAAAEVRALVERAFELKGQAGRVPELEGEVAALEDRTEELEERVEELEDEAESLREERDDLKGRLARKQADFKNYKERQKRKQAQMKERATEDLVERLVGVRDNLKRALDQDVDDDESIRGGVEMTLKEFDRVLDEENVEEISPDPGEDVDPQRHEVMMRVDSEYPEGAVAEVFNPGYEMADRVIQAAQVTVSNGAAHSSEDTEDDAAATEDDDAEGVQPETDGSGDDGESDAAATEDDEDGEAVALGGEVDEETPDTDGDVGEASDGDISAALDDE